MNDQISQNKPEQEPALDWRAVMRSLYLSRALDEVESNTNEFDAFVSSGQEFAQIVLGTMLDHPRDAACGYFRTKPLALSLGVSPRKILAAILNKDGTPHGGRDKEAMFLSAQGNGQELSKCTLLPPSYISGGQFTVALGWAKSILYYRDVLKSADWDGAIAVGVGGDASLLSSGFWAALNRATTENLPLLFFVNDNGYGGGMPATENTPGGDLHDNLRGWKNLKIVSGSGVDPEATPELVSEAISHVRDGHGTCLVQLAVPRLSGHTASDDQSYKSSELVNTERDQDPLPILKKYLVDGKIFSETEFPYMHDQVMQETNSLVQEVENSEEPSDAHTFTSSNDISLEYTKDDDQEESASEKNATRVNFAQALETTLDVEMASNRKIVLLGKNLSTFGGASGVARELADKHGSARVVDIDASTSALVGIATGMAMAGLLPVVDVDTRLDLSASMEYVHNIGSLRWRTCGRFTAPMVVRVAIGCGESGGSWSALSDEVACARVPGWKVALPSNAMDVSGLLRDALNGDDPTLFLEHRYLQDFHLARRPSPAKSHNLQFGRAKVVVSGEAVSVVSWGTTLHHICEVIDTPDYKGQVEIIDLRTLRPWDEDCVFSSVAKTGKCLIVHEDNLVAGFGAEIAARLADEVFWKLDAPIKRLGLPDVHIPRNAKLRETLIPNGQAIKTAIDKLIAV